jgi:hypothetical protein
VTNVILIKASLRRLAVGYERGLPSLNFPPFPALSKEEFLRPTFLPSAFFYSGTGLWVGRYISSSEDTLLGHCNAGVTASGFDAT